MRQVSDANVPIFVPLSSHNPPLTTLSAKLLQNRLFVPLKILSVGHGTSCKHLDIWIPRKGLPFPPSGYDSNFPSPQIYELAGRYSSISPAENRSCRRPNTLYQMICHTGEDFGEEQLTASPLAGTYFDLTYMISLTYTAPKFNYIRTGNLKSRRTLLNYSFELALRNQDILDEPDVLSTAALMKRCLHLDPADRASAQGLLALMINTSSVDS